MYIHVHMYVDLYMCAFYMNNIAAPQCMIYAVLRTYI